MNCHRLIAYYLLLILLFNFTKSVKNLFPTANNQSPKTTSAAVHSRRV
jgi:hypothetical protein